MTQEAIANATRTMRDMETTAEVFDIPAREVMDMAANMYAETSETRLVSGRTHKQSEEETGRVSQQQAELGDDRQSSEVTGAPSTCFL